MSASTSRTALVTGGTGTVGKAIVSRLLTDGWNVRVLTRKAEGTGANGVVYVMGDLEKTSALREATESCELVVHSAITNTGIDVEAAGDLADAAIAGGVKRFVHISTMSVYPVVPDGVIDESMPYVSDSSTDTYAVKKSQIEQALLAQRDRIQIGVLQPANVVDPTKGWWTAGVVELMRKGRFILVDDGAGTANLVGVGDVAAAAALAATADYESGSRFLIADGHPLPWREYLKHLETLAGGDALEVMTAAEAKRYSRSAISSSVADLPGRLTRRIARAISGGKPILPMEDAAIDRFASRAVVSIERARRVLGFTPAKTPWPANL
jgi:nucleoside-diphosphate-sugar epimerase